MRFLVFGLLSLLLCLPSAGRENPHDDRGESDGRPSDWDAALDSPFSMTDSIYGFPGFNIPGLLSFTFQIPRVANTTASDITAQLYMSKGSKLAKDGIHLLLSDVRVAITGCTLTVKAGFDGALSGGCTVSAADAASLVSLGIINTAITTQNLIWGLGPEAKALTLQASGGNLQVNLTLVTPPPVTCTPVSLSFFVVTGGTAPSQTCAAATSPGAQTLTITPSTTSGGNWLTASVNPATSPATLTVSVNAAGRGPAVYAGNVHIDASGGDSADVPILFTVLPSTAQFIQQGVKLVAADPLGVIQQGAAVAISGNGNIAAIGAPGGSGPGGAWTFVRSGGLWTQEAAKLVGSPSTNTAAQGTSVALSADGNTTLVGGSSDANGVGAGFLFTRTGGCGGAKLVGSSAIGASRQGWSVALSSDGGTALVGGRLDNNQTGAAWVFTCSAGQSSQQAKLVGTGSIGKAFQGGSVALSADGNTALVSGESDNGGAGAAWIFTRSGSVWTQQAKLVGAGAAGSAFLGTSVALSADGNTALVGGSNDNGSVGAAWVFVRSGGVWTQQGAKLVGTGIIAGFASQGVSAALSADGNTAVVGGSADNNSAGAAWVFKRSGGVWSQFGKLVGSGAIGAASQGHAVAISGDGTTILAGGSFDNSSIGATWPFILSGPAPAMTSVSPAQATAGGAGFTITVNGSNFLTGATVQWNGTPLTTTFVGATQLTASVTAGLIGTAGTVPVLVKNPEGAPSNAVTFTVIPPPTFQIAKTHAGNFRQGQNGAQYTVAVTNAAGAATSSGLVTVTETVPAGLTLVSMAGTGWTCPAPGATCTRSDALNGGSGYPPVTVTVNVAPGAAAQVTNQVSVSGGGSATASTTDPTTVSCSAFATGTSLGAGGNGGALTLTFNAASCGWTAASNDAWLVPAAASGTGATLGVTVAPNTTGAQRTGTLTVSGQTVTVTQAVNNNLQIPSLVSLNPFQGSGANANLTLVYAHPSGWAAIKSAEFIVNPRWEATSRLGGCYIKYTPGSGLFTLIADDGNSVAGTTAAGSASNISNSQCTLNAANSSVSGNATTLTVVASLTFKPAFTGQRHIWMQAVDYNNLSTNWLVYGVWFPAQTTVNAGPWYRVYDPFSNSYLYTFDKNEYDILGTRGFALQGISGLVMDGATTVGGVPNIAWYRVYVNATASHLWTSDRNEFLNLVNAQQAYVGEGVAAFVMPYINAQGQVSSRVTNTIPFYRAAFQGKNLHFWTSDADEFNGTNGKHLPAGYVGEGIASYIFPASGAQFTGSAMAAQDDAPAVVSAGNGVVAPGQALSIYGRRLGGTVLWNGAAMTVIAARDNEMQVVVPDELAGAPEVTLEIEHRGRRSEAVKLGVVAANPAIFGTNQFGRGHAQARNQDGAANDARHPAARGSIVTLDTTGIGTLPVEAHIGGWPAEVLSTRASAARAGVVEVQVRVPYGVDPADFQPVVLHVGNLFSQPGIGLAIR